jgi:ABC-type uncharacterized transport system substrate-binding protein
MKKLLMPLFAVLVMLLPATLLQASGIHYQISTSTRFYADEAGNLAGLRMNWVYDPEVSAIIVDGREPDAAGLRQLGEDIMADLYTLGYYIQLTVNGQPLAVNKVSQFTIKLVEEGSIQLGMQVELKQAMAVAGKTFRLALADPDGSALLAYSGADRIVLDNALAGKCAVPELVSNKVVLNEHEMDVQTTTVRCR